MISATTSEAIDRRAERLELQVPINVTIIIPAYNAAGTIRDTIESVLAQTYPNWEAIVVDDGSIDRTAEIARSFAETDSRIRVINQPNGGEGSARNTGINNARYDWLLFLDSDDWISPVHLEHMTGELVANPELDAVHCGSARVAADGTHVVERYSPPVGDLFPVLARRAAFNVHACIVRKSLVDVVGRFDTSLKRSPDWDLWQRVARTGARFGAVREVLAFYRMRPDSVSLDGYQMLRDGLRILKQGHSPDPRVPNPYPHHAQGLPPEGIRREEFYILSWCAGLALGSGKDARPLLELVKDDNYPELYPNAIAQCIFEAAPLPTCQPPHKWEELWLRIQDVIGKFLVALEEQSLAPDLARRATFELKRMILKYSPDWGSVIEEEEQRSANQQASIERLERERAVFEEERNVWQAQAKQMEEEHNVWQAQAKQIEEERNWWQAEAKQIEEERNRWQAEAKQIEEERNRWQAQAKQMEQEKILLQNELHNWQQLTKDAEEARASLEEELSRWQRLTNDIEQEKTLFRTVMGNWRQLAERLEQEKTSSEDRREKWRRLAEEREILITELQQRFWVRVGRRLGIRDQAIVSKGTSVESQNGAKPRSR